MTGININEARKLREVDREVGSRQVRDSCVGTRCSAPAPPLYIRDYIDLRCVWACWSWLSINSKEQQATAATWIILSPLDTTYMALSM